jgi:hypothetical protein
LILKAVAVMDRSEAEKDLAALEYMRRARLNFEERICEASATQNEAILEVLRLESMFEFAEFYFAVRVMGFNEPDDITILAKLQNQRIIDLEKNPIELRRRRLTKERVLKGMFTNDTHRVWPEWPRLIPDPRNPYEGFAIRIVEPRGKGVIVAVLSDQPITSLNIPAPPKAFASPQEAAAAIRRRAPN